MKKFKWTGRLLSLISLIGLLILSFIGATWFYTQGVFLIKSTSDTYASTLAKQRKLQQLHNHFLELQDIQDRVLSFVPVESSILEKFENVLTMGRGILGTFSEDFQNHNGVVDSLAFCFERYAGNTRDLLFISQELLQDIHKHDSLSEQKSNWVTKVYANQAPLEMQIQNEIEASLELDKELHSSYVRKVLAATFIYSSFGCILIVLMYRIIKHTERNVQFERDRFEAIFQFASSAIYLTDWNGHILLANKKASEMTGLSQEALVKKTVMDLDTEYKTLEKCNQLWSSIPAKGELNLTSKHTHSDRGTFDVRISISKVQLDNKNYLLAIVEDVSELKKMEESQQEALDKATSASALMEEAMQIAKMGHWEVDLINNKFKWSDGVYDMFGYTRDELEISYEVFISLVHEEDRAKLDIAYKEHLEKQVPYHFKHRYITKSGQVKYAIEKCKTFREENGKPIRSLGIILDITDLVEYEQSIIQAYKEIETGKLKLENIIRGTNVGTWEWNIETNEATYDDQWLEMLGYTTEDSISPSFATWEKLVHPEDKEFTNKLLALHLNGHSQHYESEHRMRHKNGQWIWILDRGRISKRDSSGKPILMHGTHMNITEKMEQQRKIALSESRFHELSKATQTFIWEIDLRGLYTYVSPSIFEVTGYKSEDLVQKKCFYDLFPTSVPSGEIQNILQKINLGEPFHEYYNEIVIKNGNKIWVSTTGIALYNSDGELVGYRGSDTNVTKLINYQNKLVEQQNLLDITLASANQGLFDLNILEGIAKVSNEYETMLGYEAGELKETNQKWLERLHPDDIKRVGDNYEKYISGKVQEYRVEFRQKTKSGKWKWILSVGKIVEWDEAGNPSRMVGTHTDIDFLKETEQKLQESEKQFKDLFYELPVAVIIHDKGGNILDANPKAWQMYGLSSLDELKQNEFWADPPYSFEEAKHAIAKANEIGSVEFEWLNKRVNSDFFWEWVRLSKLVINGQEVILSSSIDITQIKNSEEYLRKSEERYRTLLDSIPNIVYEWDLETQTGFFTGQVGEILGVEDTTYLIQLTQWLQHIEQRDQLFVEVAYKNALQQTPYHLEYKFKRNDGKYIWLEDQYLSGGKENIIRGIIRNITIERRLKQENQKYLQTLQHKEKQLSLAIETARQGLLDWQLTEDTVEINRILAEILQTEKLLFSSDELWRWVQRIFEKESYKQIREGFESLINGIQQEFLVNGVTRSIFIGKKWLKIRVSLAVKENNKPERIIATIIDNTQEKELEFHIQEVSRQMQVLVDNLPGVVISREANKDMTIKFLNEYFFYLTGFTRQELTSAYNNSYFLLVHPNDSQLLYQEIQYSLENAKPYTVSYRLLTKSQNYIWVQEMGESLFLEGKNTIQAAIFDITDRLQQEEQRFSAIINSTDRERKRIAAEIHDGLQQVLVSAMLNLDRVKKELGSLSSKVQIRYQDGMTLLHEGINGTRSIARSLLPKQLEDFGLSLAVENMVQHLDKSIKVHFSSHAHNRLPVSIETNVYRIAQEAILNTVKHAEATELFIHLWEDKDTFVMTIEDNGKGFDTRSQEILRNGFGLQSIKSRAASIGAHLEISSSSENGTLIVLEVPLLEIMPNK